MVNNRLDTTTGLDRTFECSNPNLSVPPDEIHMTSYPEFGQIDNSAKANFKNQTFKVSLIAIVTLTGLGIGIMSGSWVLGAGIMTVAAASALTYFVVRNFFFNPNHHRYDLTFNSLPHNLEAPKLGSYTQTDLRVSNHVTESFEWKKTMICAARQSIEFSPNFAGGKEFQDILQLIEKQMNDYPSLKCHLILSSVSFNGRG